MSTVRDGNPRGRLDQLARAIFHEWRTPQAMTPNALRGQGQDPMKRAAQGHQVNLQDQMVIYGRPDPVSPSTLGSRPESWPTPSAMDGQRPSETPQQWEARNAAKKAANPNLGQLHRPLTVAVQWATPKASDPQHSGPNMRDSSGNYALPAQAVRANQTGGKLNPRWVETLMGLPVGWTMPTCPSPVTIAPTNSACSATESSPQPQP